MHMLPIHVPEAMTMTGMAAMMTPWGAPALTGLVGTLANDPSAHVVGIGNEAPVSWVRTLDRFAKFDLEYTHVARFRLDFLMATQTHLFWNVREGGDPPDVKVDTVAGQRGIECTRFTLKSRLAAHGLFRAVRQRVLSRQGEAFARLTGQVVQVWFNEPDSLLTALPPRKSDDEAAEELVTALASYEPDHGALWVEGSEMPDSAPSLPLHRTSAGAHFYSIPMLGGVPDSPLFLFAGFELGLAFTTTHVVQVEWEALLSQIERKDKEGSDWLLISAGAPDADGWTYPAEEFVLQEMLKDGPPAFSLTHLQHVFVHFWSSGDVFQLWPAFEHVSGPIYGGAVQGHRTIVPISGEPAPPFETAN